MSLIHPKIIKKHLGSFDNSIKPEHMEPITNWAERIRSGEIKKHNESQLESVFIEKFLVPVLGYVTSGKAEWTLQPKESVGRGIADITLGNFNKDGERKVIAPFELKGPKVKLDDIQPSYHKTPVQQAWEYAMDAKGSKWVLVTNFIELRLYAVGYGRDVYESWQLDTLTEPSEYARFLLLLSSENLLKGRTESLLKENENVEKDITNKLYGEYKNLRLGLVNYLTKKHTDKDPFVLIRQAQTILDRVLFMAFAEDKGLLPEQIVKKAYEHQDPFNPKPVWENFKGLFRSIDGGNNALNIPPYNGGLFKHDPEIDALEIPDNICEGFKALSDYDYATDISVNILGHIFEQSISDLEEVKASIAGEKFDKKKGKRKKDGVFYTPSYITKYIVEQAVGGWLEDRKKELGIYELPELAEADYEDIYKDKKGKTVKSNIIVHREYWKKYEEVLSNIKVLDPACGSGAFLNEVFDYLYREGQAINYELTRLNGGQAHLFKWDTHILKNNIFGVDINKESVELTKLGLWIKTANRNEKLTYLEDNIRCGNSLIDDPRVAGELAFKWEEEFSEIMNKGGFDVIVGNPPYTYRGSIKDVEKDFFKRRYLSTEGNFDLYKFFMERPVTLLRKEGCISLIVPNTFLTGQTFEKLRQLLLDNFNILEVFDLGLKVFEDVVVENVVYTLKKTDTKKNDTHIKIQRNRERGILDTEKDYLLPLRASCSIGNNTFNIYLSSNVQPIISKMRENSLLLKQIAYTTVGINTGYIKADITSNMKKDERYHKMLNGKDIARNSVLWDGEWIIYDDSFVKSFGDKGRTLPPEYIFTEPKILVQRTRRGMKRKLVCYYDTEKYYNLNRLSNVVLKDKNFDLKYIYILLNSELMDFYFNNVFNEYEVKPLHLSQLPIKAISLQYQKVFVDKADVMLSTNKELQELSCKFMTMITSDFVIPKITTKLENWYLFDWNNFISELSKQKIKMTAEQEEKWLDRFNRMSTQAREIKQIIDNTDKEIDQMVYELYGLTEEEIKIVAIG